MRIQNNYRISGVGKHLPKKKVLSSEIEESLGLPEHWIEKNIGVKSRFRVEEETNTSMGASALRQALEDAQLQINDLDYLISASATFDYVLPNRSSLIKHAFEAAIETDFPCLDINTTCTSFITAMDYAAMLLSKSDCKHVAIVSSEISSKGLNPDDAETYSLFGDGAAAIILSQSHQDAGSIYYSSKTYSSEAKSTIIEGGGNTHHPRDFPYDPELYSFQMAGKKLLRSVSDTLPAFLSSFFEKTPINIPDIDLIVPHQASKLGLKMLMKLNNNNDANIVNQLASYGNCIAASIPLALVTSIQDGNLKEGQSCFLIGTAAGITISGLLFKYGRL